jgi:ABC-type transporter Mla subunit MlaD
VSNDCLNCRNFDEIAKEMSQFKRSTNERLGKVETAVDDLKIADTQRKEQLKSIFEILREIKEVQKEQGKSQQAINDTLSDIKTTLAVNNRDTEENTTNRKQWDLRVVGILTFAAMVIVNMILDKI